MHASPSMRPTGKGGCVGRTRSGALCDAPAITGTSNCRMHPGMSVEKLKAKGAVVVELRSWGLNLEEVRDPGRTLLQLMTQSAMRAELYAGLLQQAYEAAERLRAAGHSGGQLPPHADNETDEQRAIEDLDRVFSTGGVAALVGTKWAAAGKDGHLFAAEEGIRGLVRLEAEERDRCASMAAKAVAAGLAERQVRLAEQQGALVASVIRAVLGDVGVDVGSPEVQRVVATRLRELAGVA